MNLKFLEKFKGKRAFEKAMDKLSRFQQNDYGQYTCDYCAKTDMKEIHFYSADRFDAWYAFCSENCVNLFLLQHMHASS